MLHRLCFFAIPYFVGTQLKQSLEFSVVISDVSIFAESKVQLFAVALCPVKSVIIASRVSDTVPG